MKRHINFGSIEQFRNIVKNVRSSSQYIGFDEVENKPIFDDTIKFPIITAIGTEKIHGTNAAVCFNSVDGFWVQSRENIITVEKDNAGCALAVESKKEQWMDIIHELAKEYNIDMFNNIISIYFEWAGGNIQKNSALSGLNKKAIIFKHFKVSNFNDSIERSTWYETKINGIWIEDIENEIYNIHNFDTYEIEIDFSRPDISQNKMIELINEIEENSPVGKSFGIENNIGEGIVFTFLFKDELYRFKVKGEKHSTSKVKTLKLVDSEKEQTKIDFANYATPSWRLEQAYQNVFDTINGGKGDIKKTGDFLRAVHFDIIKEENDILIEKGLEPKEVNGLISNIARAWLIEQLNNEYYSKKKD